MKGDASEKPGKRPEVVTGFFKDFPVKRKRQHVSSNRFGLTATGGNGYVRWRGLPRVRSESNVIQYFSFTVPARPLPFHPARTSQESRDQTCRKLIFFPSYDRLHFLRVVISSRILISPRLTSCAGMTYHARREFFVPKL